ncbi:MAG: hypothetical protein Q4C96_00530 [Planctomycetia bacterium]|nr:hypothetical protein [Planctomycetia bacterium]
MKNLLVNVLVFAVLISVSAGCSGKKGSSGKKNNIPQQIQKLQSASAVDRATKLPPLAVRLAEETKDIPGAKRVMEDAMKACAEIEAPADKCEGYSKVAECYGKLNEKSNAKRALKQAKEAIGQLPEGTDPETLISLYAKVAKAQASMNELQDAEETLMNALAEVEKIELPGSRIRPLSDVFTVFCEIKAAEGQKKTLEVIHKLVDEVEDKGLKSGYLARTAAIQFQTDLMEAGEKTFAEAEKYADEIESLGQRALAYCELVEVAISAKLKEVAARVLDKANKDGEKEMDDTLRTLAREKVADLKKKVN